MKLNKKLELKTSRLAALTTETDADAAQDYTTGVPCSGTGLCFTWLCTVRCGSGICCPCE
jgi:hypothetical protein